MEILGVTPDFNTFKLSDSRRVVHFPSAPQFPHLQSWDSHMLLRVLVRVKRTKLRAYMGKPVARALGTFAQEHQSPYL